MGSGISRHDYFMERCRWGLDCRVRLLTVDEAIKHFPAEQRANGELERLSSYRFWGITETTLIVRPVMMRVTEKPGEYSRQDIVRLLPRTGPLIYEVPCIYNTEVQWLEDVIRHDIPRRRQINLDD